MAWRAFRIYLSDLFFSPRWKDERVSTSNAASHFGPDKRSEVGAISTSKWTVASPNERKRTRTQGRFDAVDRCLVFVPFDSGEMAVRIDRCAWNVENESRTTRSKWIKCSDLEAKAKSKMFLESLIAPEKMGFKTWWLLQRKMSQEKASAESTFLSSRLDEIPGRCIDRLFLFCSISSSTNVSTCIDQFDSANWLPTAIITATIQVVTIFVPAQVWNHDQITQKEPKTRKKENSDILRTSPPRRLQPFHSMTDWRRFRSFSLPFR